MTTPTANDAAPALPAGVFWDMDGTLVDTEPYWLAAETALVESFGGTWSTEDGLQLVGSSLERSAIILQSRGVALGVDEIVDVLTDRVLEQIGVDGALASRSPRAARRAARRRRPDRPRHHVDRPDGGARRRRDRVHGLRRDRQRRPGRVGQARPRVLPAARRGCWASTRRDSVAIEDSEYGVAAAVAAGMATIAVPLHVPLPASPAYTLWDDLEGRTAADLAARPRHARRSPPVSAPAHALAARSSPATACS